MTFGSKKFGLKILAYLQYTFGKYTFGKIQPRYPDPKLKNNWGPLSSTFHEEQPETLIEWKLESITDGPTDGQTDGPTDRQTWLGARDACASKK